MIANTIALVFRLQIEDEQDQLERSLAQYRDEAPKKMATVGEAIEKMRQIRERDGISDPDPESADAAVTGADTARMSQRSASICRPSASSSMPRPR